MCNGHHKIKLVLSKLIFNSTVFKRLLKPLLIKLTTQKKKKKNGINNLFILKSFYYNTG